MPRPPEPVKTYKRRPQVGPRKGQIVGFRDFLRSVNAIFRLSHKSDREEFTLYLKLVTLGIVVVGTIGFIIKLLGNIFFG
jgi:protein translocase SEC61 complex gamma subunit